MNKHLKIFVPYLCLITCLLLHRKFGNYIIVWKLATNQYLLSKTFIVNTMQCNSLFRREAIDSGKNMEKNMAETDSLVAHDCPQPTVLAIKYPWTLKQDLLKLNVISKSLFPFPWKDYCLWLWLLSVFLWIFLTFGNNLQQFSSSLHAKLLLTFAFLVTKKFLEKFFPSQHFR